MINHSLSDHLTYSWLAIIVQAAQTQGLPTHEPCDILLILLTIIKFHPDALRPQPVTGGFFISKYATPRINSCKNLGGGWKKKNNVLCKKQQKNGSNCRCSLQLPGSWYSLFGSRWAHWVSLLHAPALCEKGPIVVNVGNPTSAIVPGAVHRESTWSGSLDAERHLSYWATGATMGYCRTLSN